MFRLFDECPENTSVKEINRSLLETTFKSFPSLNTTELEVRHSRAFAMLKKLDVENADFNIEYNRIIAGAIIYALAFETTKYDKTEYGYLYPLHMNELFHKCNIPDSKLYYEELILVFAKKALEEKVIPFDDNTIKKYFGCFHDNEKNPLRRILLERFSSTPRDVLESDSIVEPKNNHRCGCRLF